MLPLTLLKGSEGQDILIELKNGDTYNGKLISCNMFMNITIRDVTRTNKDGDQFWEMPECFIRGNCIKYLRIPDEIINNVAEEEIANRKAFRGGRGGAGGRGSGGRGGYNNNNNSNYTQGGRGEGRGGDGGRGRGRGRGGESGGGRGRGRGRGGHEGTTTTTSSTATA
jgi:U6 snRNA-associated Sm-like protein LSm4